MNTFHRKLALSGLLIGLCAPLYVTASSSIDTTKASGPTTLSKDDIEFLGNAAQADMTEVQAAAIASSRSLTVNTKFFANTMTTDHQESNEELHVLAATKGVMLPTQLDSKHQSELDDLQKIDTRKFDAAYADAMTRNHKEAVSLFGKAATKSKDVDIRQFANSALPTLQQHLDMARHLNEES